MSTCSQKLAKLIMQRKNPYLNTNYNSFYNFDLKEKTFNNTKYVKIKSYIVQAKPIVQNNQKTKSVPRVKIIKAKIPKADPFVDQGNYKVLKEPKYTSEAETETATKSRLIMGIETPLNTIFIALQDRKERNQDGLSKQNASVTPPFV